MPVGAATCLDANAGAPLRPEAIEALLSLLKEGALVPNPSSQHSLGRKARRWVTEARDKIALSLGKSTDPVQTVFTSSGTEANQLAIRSVLEPLFDRGESPHWITTPVEHDSVLQLVEWARSRGGSVSFLPVDSAGAPEALALEALWRPETRLVSAIWVNNETGVVSDVARLAAETRRLGGSLHLDAAQAWGKLALDAAAMGAQYLALSGHKIGAPSGVGVLWAAPGARVSPLIRGRQERERRGGSENTLGIVALGAAASALAPEEWAARVAPLRDRLETLVKERIPGAIVNGAGAPRVANTLSLSFDGIEKEGLVAALDLEGYCVSSGSACSAGVTEPSRVLQALGRGEGMARASVRVSLADTLPSETLDGLVGALERAVGAARREAPSSGVKVESRATSGMGEETVWA